MSVFLLTSVFFQEHGSQDRSRGVHFTRARTLARAFSLVYAHNNISCAEADLLYVDPHRSNCATRTSIILHNIFIPVSE